MPRSRHKFWLTPAPTCSNSQLAELGLDRFQGFLLGGAGGFMGRSTMSDPDPQHSNGLQIISGIEDNRGAKWD